MNHRPSLTGRPWIAIVAVALLGPAVWAQDTPTAPDANDALTAQWAEVLPDRWPELTAEQQEAATVALRERVASTREKLGLPLEVHETNYFLFASDLPPREAKRWARLLDDMYRYLCRLFEVKRETNLFKGRALIYVFRKQEDYRRFEIEIMGSDPGWSLGRCHINSHGDVVISFFRQEEELTFATVLVHESSHGFLHRYFSGFPVVSWANEGMADVIANDIVPRSGILERQQELGRAEVRKRGNLGGLFSALQIEPWQYGVASDITAYLIKTNRPGYVKFIRGIKDGQTWRASLKEHMGLTPEELADRYGRYIRVRGLTP